MKLCRFRLRWECCVEAVHGVRAFCLYLLVLAHTFRLCLCVLRLNGVRTTKIRRAYMLDMCGIYVQCKYNNSPVRFLAFTYVLW
ncbi:hypothetical protein HMPREF3190_01623 [Umbribacter vaginalis]|nr:hypothetical protein HMPREF3190_01623 [Coriobacteriales bacterium DNF00809]